MIEGVTGRQRAEVFYSCPNYTSEFIYWPGYGQNYRMQLPSNGDPTGFLHSSGTFYRPPVKANRITKGTVRPLAGDSNDWHLIVDSSLAQYSWDTSTGDAGSKQHNYYSTNPERHGNQSQGQFLFFDFHVESLKANDPAAPNRWKGEN